MRKTTFITKVKILYLYNKKYLILSNREYQQDELNILSLEMPHNKKLSIGDEYLTQVTQCQYKEDI